MSKLRTALLLPLLLTISACAGSAKLGPNDPLEPINRKIFWFNNEFDDYIFKPVATGYKAITPDPVRRGVTNFFRNIKTPIYLVSDLLQAKFEQAGIHTARFVINTIGGIGGVMDL